MGVEGPESAPVSERRTMPKGKPVTEGKKKGGVGFFDLLAVLWFCMCGWIHIFLEGAWVLWHASVATSPSLVEFIKSAPAAFESAISGPIQPESLLSFARTLAGTLWKDY